MRISKYGSGRPAVTAYFLAAALTVGTQLASASSTSAAIQRGGHLFSRPEPKALGLVRRSGEAR